jgi:hypothetical protein
MDLSGVDHQSTSPLHGLLTSAVDLIPDIENSHCQSELRTELRFRFEGDEQFHHPGSCCFLL